MFVFVEIVTDTELDMAIYGPVGRPHITRDVNKGSLFIMIKRKMYM